MKVLILYYSMYGNNFRMTQAVAEGVREGGGEPMVRMVPELIPAEVIEKDKRLKKAKEIQKDVPLATQDDLITCDGLILGSPTRFGNMCAQMRNFWNRTTQIWLKGQLIGKPAGVFTSTASMHGGQETTLLSMMFTLIHHGMIIVGVPYSVEELITTERGGTPYGASAVVGPMADQPPTEIDLKIGRVLGKRVTEVAGKLKSSKNDRSRLDKTEERDIGPDIPYDSLSISGEIIPILIFFPFGPYRRKEEENGRTHPYFSRRGQAKSNFRLGTACLRI